jgi:alginate O-acetyltransferase complex protein AlgI
VAYGTNTAFLRWWSYWRDVERGEARVPFARYGAWAFFFPLFMGGPIERERDFRDRERAPGSPGAFWDRAENAIAGMMRHPALLAGAVGASRIALGYAKVQIALRFVPQSLEVFDRFEAMDRLALWLWAARLWVNFYLVFSGWIDVALGLSRWLGLRPRENFRAPWLATSVADFWRRWHVSFGAWLREYVYFPLGGSRRGNVHMTIQIVFLVSALWHAWGGYKLLGFRGQTWNYLLWGALNGVGVSAARIWQARRDRGAAPVLPLPAPARSALCAVATFLYVSLTWIPFYTPPTVPLRRFLQLIARMFGIA